MINDIGKCKLTNVNYNYKDKIKGNKFNNLNLINWMN